MKKLGWVLLLFGSLAVAQQSKRDIPFTEFRLQSNSCTGINYASGSQVMIPEDAFGVPNSKVTLKYRELHDQIDMLLSGVPMIYENGYLISGGMFELYAFDQAGKELQIKKGKKVQVLMSCFNNIAGLETFRFDKLKNTWTKIKATVQDITISNKDDSDLWIEGTNSPFEIENGGWNGDEECCWDIESYKRWKIIDESRNAVLKSMEIEYTGLYNYDAIANYEDNIPFAIDVKLEGDTNTNYQLIVAYKGINTVLYYGTYQFKTNFSLLARDDVKVFTVVPNGDVYLWEGSFTKTEIEGLKDKNFTFVLKKVAKPVQSANDMAVALDLKRVGS